MATVEATLRRSGYSHWPMLILFLVACFGAAAIGSSLTTSALSDWYPTLAKPSFNPPNWIFGPVWTVLYLMMAVAGWLAWRVGPPPSATAVWTPYFTQLALNTAWSGIFFYLHSPGWAFAEIILLWLAIAATIIMFYRRRPLAAWLLTPYLAWVTFAALLNLAIWRLNV
jgi:benzodiazapine receptor